MMLVQKANMYEMKQVKINTYTYEDHIGKRLSKYAKCQCQNKKSNNRKWQSDVSSETKKIKCQSVLIVELIILLDLTEY